jgi:hypothetical protein
MITAVGAGASGVQVLVAGLNERKSLIVSPEENEYPPATYSSVPLEADPPP